MKHIRRARLRARLITQMVGGLLALASTWAGAAEDHSHHQAPAAPAAAVRTLADYRLPAVKLQRADGTRVDFATDIDDGRPVFVNFIYTTCTAICPVMTQIFAAVQTQLGADAAKVRFVSLSIDPEQDTPKRLSEYARQYRAGPDWTFYTGTLEASIAVQKGFAAYRGDKMNHTPLTLIRAAPGKPWIRLDGFASPEDLMQEYRKLMAAAR